VTLTTMSKEGKLIVKADPRETLRQHQETADWEFRDEAAFWYGVSQKMDERFFNGFVYPDGRKVPAPFIAFDDLRNKNTIAQYDLFPDEYGIVGKITFNTAHYIDQVDEKGRLVKVWERGRYSQGETMLHEYLHLWQQIGRGKDPYKWEKHRKETHNKEWHQKARELGLHPEGPAGVHTRPATVGSPIDLLLKEQGIYPPEGAYDTTYDNKTNWAYYLIYKDKEKPKGRSTLHKWVCPDCGLNVRIRIGSDPRLVHDVCSEIKGEKVFLVRHDVLAHTIYESTTDDEKPKKGAPAIIGAINAYLKENAPAETDDTVETIAEKTGINRSILYEWLERDSEFTTALEQLKEVQENDPFKTGSEEDTYVNSIMIALLLLETKDRHYKAGNI
jgi:hypothetical protein